MTRLSSGKEKGMTKNKEIARIFSTMADILEFKGENVFKIRAYRKASANIEKTSVSIEELSKEELQEIPGIGLVLASKIEEYLQVGSMHAFENLKKELPQGVLDLLAVPGLAPRTLRLIYDQLQVGTLKELEKATAEHRLAGIGEKTRENILRVIETIKQEKSRMNN
jgi:DNA polymerase (family 10)